MRLEEAINQFMQPKLRNRLYPYVLPQKPVLPAVVYNSVSIERVHALQKDTGFVKHRLQFSTYAKTAKQATETASIIRAELSDFSGDMAGLSIGGVLLISEVTDYEKDTDLYSVKVEFEFQYEEG